MIKQIESMVVILIMHKHL